MEAPSWKQQLALASYLAVLAGFVARMLVPEYIGNPGFSPAIPYNLAAGIAVGAFFLPFFWWRTTIGYVAGIILGIATVVTWTGAIASVVDETLPLESYIMIIPGIVFALLLIGSSVLAWRER